MALKYTNRIVKDAKCSVIVVVIASSGAERSYIFYISQIRLGPINMKYLFQKYRKQKDQQPFETILPSTKIKINKRISIMISYI